MKKMGLVQVLIASACMCVLTNTTAAPTASTHAMPASAAPSSTSAGAAWAIKGLGLGSTVEQFKALFPDAKCESFADPTIASCSAGTTLANAPARLRVKYLDGAAVYVAIQHITWDQAHAGGEALIGKFGTPTRFDTVRFWDGPRAGDTVQVPIWVDGNIELYPTLRDWHDDRKGITYSAVVLIDMHKHNDVWVPRFNGKAGAVPGDI